MSIRLITGAALAAAATGVAGGLAGVDQGALLLMASGLVLTVVAIGIALAALTRRRSAVRPSAPTIQPRGKDDRAHSGNEAPSHGEVGPGLTPDTRPGPPSVTGSAEFRPKASLRRIEPRGLGAADVLDAFMQSCRAAGPVESAHLWLLDETTDTVRLVAAVGAVRPADELLSPDSDPVTRASHSGVAALAPVDCDSGEGRRIWRFAVPLSAGALRGAAAVDLSTRVLDRESLIAVSAHLRGSLTAALSTYVTISEAAAVEALLDASREITRIVDAQTIAETALARALQLTGGSSGSIVLQEPDGNLRIRVARGLPDSVVSAPIAPESAGIVSLVMTTARAVMVGDPGDRGARGRRHGVRSATVAPIADADGALGVLSVENDLSRAWRSSHRLRTLESLGTIVAIALRNAEALSRANELYLETVKALALALETKDPYSHGCTERVYALALQLGEELGLEDEDLRALGFAALLHDIGMAAAGDLNAVADRPLTTVEQGMLKMHPIIAADVVKRAPVLKAAVPIVYHHHEHFDGGGYVAGLAGDQIPVGARVLAVADAFVAMTASRTYRPTRTVSEALAEIESAAGTQFDPAVVTALIALMTRNAVR